MIDYLNNHLHTFWFIVGFALLAIEVLALGFATGFVLFLGLAALVTGGLIWFSMIPATWLGSISAFSISSVLISIALWKPLKALQQNNETPKKDNSSDIIGMEFRLSDAISLTEPGKTRYSGIEWRVEIDSGSSVENIASGELVSVTSVDAGKLMVIPANPD